MKVDFSKPILTLDGKAVTEKNEAGAEVPVELKDLCLRALTTPMEEDRALTGEQAFKRLELARAVHKGSEQELDAADAVLIRDRAAKLFGIVASGQVYEALR